MPATAWSGHALAIAHFAEHPYGLYSDGWAGLYYLWALVGVPFALFITTCLLVRSPSLLSRLLLVLVLSMGLVCAWTVRVRRPVDMTEEAPFIRRVQLRATASWIARRTP